MTIRAGSDKGHLAYHLIQFFAPGEVTPEKAHQIRRELADKVLEGRYVGDSMSITSQKAILEKTAREMGFHNTSFYVEM